MTRNNRAVLEAVLRNNLNLFTHRCFQTVAPSTLFLSNWHIDAICLQLERVLRGDVRRLIITLPPRGLKSICGSVALPAFALGHDPSMRIVCASYSHELASKHARDCRSVVESRWYKDLFPQTRLAKRKNSELEFETTKLGYRLSTSVGGTLTGRGGQLIIIDDPLKPADAYSETRRASVNDWYDTTLSSRLDSKKHDAIVIIMQRLHMDDLVGHVLEKDPDALDAPQSACHRRLAAVDRGRPRALPHARGRRSPPPRARATARARPPEASDGHAGVLGAVPAAPGPARWCAHPTRLVPLLHTPSGEEGGRQDHPKLGHGFEGQQDE